MLTISLIGTLPPVKGLSPYTLHLCKALAQKAEIDFIGFKRLYPERLYPGGTNDASTHKPEIPNLTNRSFLTWYNPLGWAWAGLSCKGEIVHAQWWSHILAPVYFTILLLAKLRKKKIVVTVHNVKPHENNLLTRFLNGSIFNIADHFIVHSEFNKNIFCKEHHFEPNKVTVIPHGIIAPQNIFNPLNNTLAPSALRASPKGGEESVGFIEGLEMPSLTVELSPPLGGFRGPEFNNILFFGTIRPYKGVDVLIKAFKQLKSSDAKLVIAGKCWENPQKYLDLIANDPTIEFLDSYIPDSEIANLFEAATCIVLPYLEFESASGVCGLALHFGKPLLVSTVGSLPDTVLDHEHCLVNPGNIEELSLKLQTILTDTTLQQKLREQSAELAKRLSWEGIAEKTLKAYC